MPYRRSGEHVGQGSADVRSRLDERGRWEPVARLECGRGTATPGGQTAHLALHIVDLGADDPRGLDALEPHLAIDPVQYVAAQASDLATYLGQLRTQHPFHLTAKHDLELQLVLSSLRGNALGVVARLPCGPTVVVNVGGSMPRAKERERSQHDPPQPDQQADLHLLLGVTDHHEEDRDAAKPEREQYARSAKDAPLAWTCGEGGHGASLAIGGRCSVSPGFRFVVS